MLKKMEIVAIIPARGGSKGVLRKNIKLLNGNPLITYSIKAAQNSQYINKVVVSTDDKEIMETALQYNASVPYLRPFELSTDDASTVDVIIHMVKYLINVENYIPDYVCVLQCTSPLRTSADIDNSISLLLSRNVDGLVSVCESEINPYWTNIFDGERLKYFIEKGKTITKRQDLPKIYRNNGAIYLVKTEVLLSEKSLEPKNITGYIMPIDRSIDIDTELDFKIAELIMEESGINA